MKMEKGDLLKLFQDCGRGRENGGGDEFHYDIL
jgi:hypothetical protein